MNTFSLIINADDLGYSTNINAAIIQCFNLGWISSATIMANMPGFEEACALIQRYNLFDHVGVHLDLTEGIPLTDGIKHQYRFCDSNGVFRKSRDRRIFSLTSDEKIAVEKELRSQIMRCQKNGLKLTHVDTHHHIHEEIGVILTVVPLMREFEIPYIRIMNNTSESCTVIRKFYVMIFNKYLKYRQLSKTHYLGSITDYINFTMKYPNICSSRQCFEIMTHPNLNKNGVIIDALSNRPMRQLINEAGLNRGAVSFCGAIYNS